MNATTVQRIEQLYPGLKMKAYQLIQLLSLKNIDVEISQGLRSWATQEMLYEQGRSLPGPIVTNATPAESFHTYGLAFDVDLPTATGIDWTGTSPAWQQVISIGESIGIVSGSTFRTFPDRPHFQLGKLPLTPDETFLNLYQSGGLPAVWSYVDGLQG
jgi:peptidoglycan L-alanyl-D-glutamate endopeptidase CwlK